MTNSSILRAVPEVLPFTTAERHGNCFEGSGRSQAAPMTCDARALLDIGHDASGRAGVTLRHKPRRPGGNGPCTIAAGVLAEYPEQGGMNPVRGASNHPPTPGKIERCRQTLGSLTPAGICFGRGPAILAERVKIRKRTIQSRA